MRRPRSRHVPISVLNPWEPIGLGGGGLASIEPLSIDGTRSGVGEPASSAGAGSMLGDDAAAAGEAFHERSLPSAVAVYSSCS